MDTISSLGHALPRLKIEMGLEDFEKCGMTPWFSFRALIPTRPLPDLHERPQIRTARLLVRPLVHQDVDAFVQLRQAHTQVYSRLRGRPDISEEDSRAQLARLNADDQSHWYFGAFLQETGELVGEGGLPDVRDRDMSASGWPEGEFDIFGPLLSFFFYLFLTLLFCPLFFPLLQLEVTAWPSRQALCVLPFFS